MELTGLGEWAFSAFEYGDKWRIHRRLFHEFFTAATVDRYDEDQKKAASRLLNNLSEHPADFRHHIQLATGSIALSIAYGIRVDSTENPYFRVAEETTESLQAALVPGAFPVEFLPFRELYSLRRFLRHTTKLNPTDSSLFSIVVPWRRFPQLRGARLQILNK